MIKNQPIIGHVLRHFAKQKPRPNLWVKEEVKDAVINNGGMVIGIMPPPMEMIVVNSVNERYIYENLDKLISKENKQLLIDEIEMCDGIILQGGEIADVHEVFIAKYCYEHNIPLLGICEGQSNLLRGIGGTTRRVDNAEKHNQSDATYVHDIIIQKNSLLYKIVGKTKIKVNSRHNYTPCDVAGLTISAYDDDGNIEVVEAADKKFYLGMRYHPESLAPFDKNHNKIFEYFVQVCKENSNSN